MPCTACASISAVLSDGRAAGAAIVGDVRGVVSTVPGAFAASTARATLAAIVSDPLAEGAAGPARDPETGSGAPASDVGAATSGIGPGPFTGAGTGVAAGGGMV